MDIAMFTTFRKARSRLVHGLHSVAAAGTVFGFMVSDASAQLALGEDFGGVADRVTGQMGQFGELVGGASTLLGIGFAALAIVKFKAYSNNPHDPNNKITTAVGMTAAAAALIALPAFMGVGIASFFGDSADLGTLSGGGVETLK